MRIRTKDIYVVNGRLKQIGSSFRVSGKYKNRSAVFLCECGNRKVIEVSQVSAGNTMSCGCLNAESRVATHTKHGHSKVGNRSSEYQTWYSMKQRCENKNNTAWDNYGGRGITVCEEWQDFSAFLDDMGTKPFGYSIERIDNNSGYSKDNCRWASRKEQQRNRRENIMFEFNGKTQCLTEWSEELGISPATVFSRLHRGWSVEKSLTHPIRKSKKANP